MDTQEPLYKNLDSLTVKNLKNFSNENQFTKKLYVKIYIIFENGNELSRSRTYDLYISTLTWFGSENTYYMAI